MKLLAKLRGKRGRVFKIDFQKAFDSMDWDYLNFVMEKMEFHKKWKGWISICLNSTIVSILVNGSPTSKFRMEKGLRKSDPLSSFLFLIVAEGFNVLMIQALELGHFKGF